MAKIYLWRRNPQVIVVAGTTNRHWIKEYIIEGMQGRELACRGNRKNFNAEIGLPLSILGIMPAEDENSKFQRWSKILWQGLKISLGSRHCHSEGVARPLRQSDSPASTRLGEAQDDKKEYLILEMAIDKPDDIDYLLGIVQPQIAIFTTITMIYPENFDNLDQIAIEYQKLINALPKNGLAILNADDERIIKLKQGARCRVLTYGVENENADYSANNIGRVFDGLEFKIISPEMDIISPEMDIISPEMDMKLRAASSAVSSCNEDLSIRPLSSAPPAGGCAVFSGKAIKKVAIKRFGMHHVYAKLVEEIIINQLINSSPLAKQFSTKLKI